MQANFDSLDNELQNSIVSLTKMKGFTNIFNHTPDLPVVVLFLITLILFYLQNTHNISSTKHIVILVIGLTTTYTSARNFVPLIYKDISTQLDRLTAQLGRDKYFLDIVPSKFFLDWEIESKEEFIECVKSTCKYNKSNLIHSLSLSTFPTILGVMEYVSSI